MDRKTIIYVVKDPTKREFVVRNRNTDDMPVAIRTYYNDLLSDNIVHSNIEYELSSVFNQDTFEIINVFDACNHYNTDQKEINIAKDNQTNKFISQGWVENPNLDVNENIKGDSSKIEAAYNARNFVTLKKEECDKIAKEVAEFKKNAQNQIDELQSRLDKTMANIDIQGKEYDKLVKQYKMKKEDLTNIESRISKGNAMINELLDKYKDAESLSNKYADKEIELSNAYKAKFDELEEKYQNKKKQYDDILYETNDASIKLDAVKMQYNQLINEFKDTDLKYKQIIDAEMYAEFMKEFPYGFNEFRHHKKEIIDILNTKWSE